MAKDKAQKEDQEVERLVREAPKVKPPRKDKRRERIKSDDDSKDPDLGGDDMSLNFKVVGSSSLLNSPYLFFGRHFSAQTKTLSITPLESSRLRSAPKEKSLMKLSSDQLQTTEAILTDLDKVAQAIQDKHEAWGLDVKVAKSLVNHLDKTADRIEQLLLGASNLEHRKASIMLKDPSFARKAKQLLGEDFDRVAAVLQRDQDEDFMDSFESGQVLESDGDEAYMAAFDDDQSSSVSRARSTTGRPLVP